MHTLDTNAIIYYFKDDPKVVSVLRHALVQNTPLYISTITEVELFGFPDLSPQESQTIDKLLKTIAIIPLDSRIARTAGLIRRAYQVKTADSVIAATALFTASTLLTRNVRDFKQIPNLNIQEI